MRHTLGPAIFMTMALVLTSVAPTQPPRAERQPPMRNEPRLEPVAETRLLMDGLNQANFRGLNKLLADKPADADSWTFIRGQALLIAETGNLLLMRPPNNDGQRAWMDRSIDMRVAATRLARAASESDYPRSRAAFAGVADSCNRCHQTFRVPTRVTALPGPEGKP